MAVDPRLHTNRSQHSLRPIEEHELDNAEGLDLSIVGKFNNAKALVEVPKWDWDHLFSLLD